MAEEKPRFSPDTIEFEHLPDGRRNASSKPRFIESARLGLTVLGLLMAITIVGTSGETLAVYNKTHVSNQYLLPLWPYSFNLSPTIALVTCGSILILSNLVSIVSGKVLALRSKALLHSILSILTPLISVIAALVAISFFYSINTSDTVETVLSWSCRWSDVDMTQQPRFGTLCKESKAALYMTVAMVPLQVIILVFAGWAYINEKSTATFARKGSPALS